MAATLMQVRGTLLGVGGFSRRFTKICCTLRHPSKETYIFGNTLNQESSSSRKYVHSFVYEKDEDPGVELDRVPETVISQPETQKSPWVPHPKTGVFGPPEHIWTGGDHQHYDKNREGESVLEQHAWFRPLEDVQKQPYN